MYEKCFLGIHLPVASRPAWLLCNTEDIEGDIEVADEWGEIELINDLEGTPSNLIASGSNALLSEVQVASVYEAVVIDRLDIIAVSSILSACFLFLLFLHSYRR